MRPHDPWHDLARDRRPRRFRDLKKVPVLPSLITLGNLFFGFLAMAKVADAVMLSARGQQHPEFSSDVQHVLEVASILVFVAMVFDALDGTVARLTRQTTKFGAQLDSLADVVTFGVAPAFLAKVLIEFHHRPPIQLLPFHPKIYYVAAAVYVLCAALRLARFNVESAGPSPEDHKEFKGLPSPAAAAIVCSLVAFKCAPPDPSELSHWLLPDGARDAIVQALPLVLVFVGLLMVSRLPYPHVMYQLVRKRHSFPYLLGLVGIVGFAALEWQFALLLLTQVYLLTGIGLGFWRLVTTGSLRKRGLEHGVQLENEPKAPTPQGPTLN